MVRAIERVVSLALLISVAVACGGGQPEPESAEPVIVARSTGATAASPPAPKRIGDSDVADTSENRAVIAFCERYRAALEARDARTLLALASPNYREDAGTPDPDDDTTYDDLRDYLNGMFEGVEKIDYRVRYRNVRSDGGRLVVELSYAASFVIRGESHDRQDTSELVLERHAGSYRILSGM